MKRNIHPDSTARLDHMCGAITRRNFLRGTGGAALGATAGVSLSFAPQLMAQSATNAKTLVYVFLRGAMDGLSFVVPTGNDANGQAYRAKRNQTRMVPDDGDVRRRPIVIKTGNTTHPFGLHPAATGFAELWSKNKLAIVQACGHLPVSTQTRSHFDAQEQIELGTPGVLSSTNGWLARHLATTPDLVDNAIFNAIAAGGSPPSSLLGWSDAVTLSSTGNFHPNPNHTFTRTSLDAVRAMYTGGSDLDVAAQAAFGAVDMVSTIDFNGYTPGGGAVYPDTGIGRNLRLIATLMRQNMGLSAATVDVGGWDTHNGQGVFEYGGYYNNVRDLTNAITAFYKDLSNNYTAGGFADRVAIVVQSEFGRQVTENESQGTDHGLGNPMFIIGGKVKGGLYGGDVELANLSGDAVRPKVDFRQVLGTVVDKLMGNAEAGNIFNQPESPFTYSPMGFTL